MCASPVVSKPRFSPVYGEMRGFFQTPAHMARNEMVGACGAEGKYFEERRTLMKRLKGWLKND